MTKACLMLVQEFYVCVYSTCIVEHYIHTYPHPNWKLLCPLCSWSGYSPWSRVLDFICSLLVDIIIKICNVLLFLLHFKLKYCSLNGIIFSYFYKNCFKQWHFINCCKHHRYILGVTPWWALWFQCLEIITSLHSVVIIPKMMIQIRLTTLYLYANRQSHSLKFHENPWLKTCAVQ